ncbi:MAG: helix-turn-helix domain-containing protein [Ramlibacter sp.]|uniref:IclR family transcriptional regulator n=1 Tax=Ramlibacter sp. TaxID=1917967 RepID=UPI0026331DF3|nr:helix-turn-helix domain-containing protein [Ramlibacter sp.]MDH4376526.1 helix-turn-helix domain-containing protein [Ramlibacter sp.]
MRPVTEATTPPRRPAPGQVMPFARALALLATFTPQERWLGLSEMARRAGLPSSTAARLARALAACGYLHHDTEGRRFRLTASVMALGYGAAANSAVRKAARLPMAAFARQNDLHVVLCGRERLDLIVLDSCESPHRPHPPLNLGLHVGARVGIAASPMGWALLAVLPGLERQYLLDSLERRAPRTWAQERRRASEAMGQVREKGWCSSSTVGEDALTVIATPLRDADQSPLVLACIGPSEALVRARVDREIGPRLAGIATSIQDTRGL